MGTDEADGVPAAYEAWRRACWLDVAGARGKAKVVGNARRIEVERLSDPRSVHQISSPVDLAVTIDGTKYVLAVLEDSPGRRLVVFTDETNGTETPDIGRWLVLPLLASGNHLPMRIEVGQRAYLYAER